MRPVPVSVLVLALVLGPSPSFGAAKHEASGGTLSLRCVPEPTAKRPRIVTDTLTLYFVTLDAPIRLQLSKDLLSYEREDGRPYFAGGPKVRIEEKIVRFGGIPDRLSFVTESADGNGPAHYSLIKKKGLMTKVETNGYHEGNPPDTTVPLKENATIMQFRCGRG